MLKLLMRSTPLLGQNFQPSGVGSKISERAISDFSKKAIETNAAMKKEKILSFEEFQKERCCSLENYIKWSKPAFPEKTDEMFKKTYEKTCASRYRAYKKACDNPGYSPGLMLDSYFFEEEKPK